MLYKFLLLICILILCFCVWIQNNYIEKFETGNETEYDDSIATFSYRDVLNDSPAYEGNIVSVETDINDGILTDEAKNLILEEENTRCKHITKDKDFINRYLFFEIKNSDVGYLSIEN
jgi:hypothetical protein